MRFDLYIDGQHADDIDDGDPSVSLVALPDYDDDGEEVPAFFNSAGVRVDENSKSVTLSVSVGDPRGAFTFELREWTDPDTGEETYLLHLPYPGEFMPHMKTVEKHPGTLRVVTRDE